MLVVVEVEEEIVEVEEEEERIIGGGGGGGIGEEGEEGGGGEEGECEGERFGEEDDLFLLMPLTGLQSTTGIAKQIGGEVSNTARSGFTLRIGLFAYTPARAATAPIAVVGGGGGGGCCGGAAKEGG